MEEVSGAGGEVEAPPEPTTPRKVYKLFVHSPQFCSEDLVIRSEDFPGVSAGDVLEVHHEEDQGPRLLLQVRAENLYPENKLTKVVGKDTVYIERSIAETFQLSNFKSLVVTKVEPERVALDSVELLFKEQYLGRSEMWRLKQSLQDSVVFLNKKISFCKDSVRCSVNEMWGSGDRVACGFVNQETKVVFRSTSAMVYIFIQMASEMWDFDTHGDLYFEKAVNGFLFEMFRAWQATSASHEVTIVLFSRTFYAAREWGEFPEHVQECLQQDYRGRFYEDFYRVVVQNEKFEDWFPTLTLLRQTFTDYRKLVLEYHDRPGVRIPAATNSTASQGNFLEVLNISLNTFEKHFINRNLDRTGQQAIVITPGAGIFEVDRDLTVITKQRIIDSGVGSDLICVGEQPLHAVPLFKMHTRGGEQGVREDFSMPHWINLSFYTTPRKLGYSSFVPRIKLPPLRDPGRGAEAARVLVCHFPPSDTPLPTSAFGYDEHDAAVFGALPKAGGGGAKSLSGSQANLGQRGGGGWPQHSPASEEGRSRRGSMDDSVLARAAPRSSSTAISIPPANRGLNAEVYSKTFSGEYRRKETVGTKLAPGKQSMEEASSSLEPAKRGVFGSAGSFDASHLHAFLGRPGRALVNPFDPGHAAVKVTSNRRRWTHIFPKGPSGSHQQAHLQPPAAAPEEEEPPATRAAASLATLQRISDVSVAAREAAGRRRERGEPPAEVKLGSFLWGAMKDLTRDATLVTGVDWKSINFPACLPITTDYFPDQATFDNDYVVNQHQLVPDELNADYPPRTPMQKGPLSAREVFRELISQRLAQGFQLIVCQAEDPRPGPEDSSLPPSMTSSFTGAIPAAKNRGMGQGRQRKDTVLVRDLRGETSWKVEEFWLSIGRNFHHLVLTHQLRIEIFMYRPRHPYPQVDYHYRYRFMAPDNDNYEMSFVEFNTEKLENYNWNYLDYYVATRGDQEEFVLGEKLKHWRFRLYVLPVLPFLAATAATRDSGQEARCDGYTAPTAEERINMAEGFLRFLETCLNKIKRPSSITSDMQRKKSRCNTMAVGELKHSNFMRFRERVGSRGRDRVVSGPAHASRPGERHRTESGGGPPAAMEPLTQTVGDSGSHDSVFGAAGLETGVENQEQRDFKQLRSTSSPAEILEAMRNPNTGLAFLASKATTLPPTTFVSTEAVLWLLEHVEGVEGEAAAIEVMQGLLAAGLVCHASGNPSHPFVYGFYLYFVPEGKERGQYQGDMEAFSSDWVEVALEPFRQEAAGPAEPPNFLKPDIRRFSGNVKDFHRKERREDAFKRFSVEVDSAGKSDRPEWAEGRCQARFRPNRSFELRLNWTVATGALVTELVSTWARKAQQNGLCIVPLPGDPFALPSQDSDPIRGPIYIELDTECLRRGADHLFQEFSEDSWDHRLFLFRESIVKRFGFVACSTDSNQQRSSATFSTHHQYIHCTGNCFVLIPTLLPARKQGILGLSSKKASLGRERREEEPPRENVIRRTADGQTQLPYSHNATGFLWSWNFMISKRWRSLSTTGATGDIAFMDKLLADFRRFCDNREDRLVEYWRECQACRGEP